MSGGKGQVEEASLLGVLAPVFTSLTLFPQLKMDSGDDTMRPQVYEVTQPLCDTLIHPFNLKRFGLHPTGGVALWWAGGARHG